MNPAQRQEPPGVLFSWKTNRFKFLKTKKGWTRLDRIHPSQLRPLATSGERANDGDYFSSRTNCPFLTVSMAKESKPKPP